MGGVLEKIYNKRIVIWGTGILQKDLEGLYPFPEFLYYVDEIPIPDKGIYDFQKLIYEDQKGLLIILCTDELDWAIEKLKLMGYGREQYIIGKELLMNYPAYEHIREQNIYLWGTGGSYFYREEAIRKYLPHLSGFIVTEKQEEMFQGKRIWSMADVPSVCQNSFIVVVSIYYEEIYKSLIRMGFQPGKNFIHIDTLLILAKLSTRTHGTYQFTDRKKDRKDLLVVLAGYKEFVWESVFSRLHEYAPLEMDVCIVTSGLTNELLKDMCEKYQWSYLSTERNHVSLAVNLAICLHPDAEYIYKMDEDIFVTEEIFEIMKSTYQRVEEESNYSVGFVAPLIPVNGYSYVRLLKRFHGEHLWKERFGSLKYTSCGYHHRTIHCDPAAAVFMWGEGNEEMDSMDEMQSILKKQEFQYSVCPIRYSIGFILFHRENWIQMETFPVPEYMNMGTDEEHICQCCMMQGRAMVIAENAVAGHLSYGLQTEKMKEYYNTHKRKFLPGEKGKIEGKETCFHGK